MSAFWPPVSIRRSAAWVKFNSSAAATKYSRWRNFMDGYPLFYKPDHRSVRQLQIQKHEIEFLLPEAFNGLFRGTHHHSTEADILQKCPKRDPAGPDRHRPLTPLVGLACLGAEYRGPEWIS